MFSFNFFGSEPPQSASVSISQNENNSCISTDTDTLDYEVVEKNVNSSSNESFDSSSFTPSLSLPTRNVTDFSFPPVNTITKSMTDDPESPVVKYEQVHTVVYEHIEKIIAQKDDLEVLNEEKNEKIEELNKRLIDLEEQLANAQQRDEEKLTILSDKWATLNVENDTLKHGNENLNLEIENLRENLAKSTSLVDKMNEEMKMLKKMNIEQLSEIGLKKLQNEELEAALRISKQDLFNLEQNFIMLQSKQDSLKSMGTEPNEIQNLKNEVKALRECIGVMEMNYADNNQQLEQEKELLLDEMNKKDALISNLSAVVNALQENC